MLLAGQSNSDVTGFDSSFVNQLENSNVDLDYEDAMMILTSPEYGDIFVPKELEQITQSRSGRTSVTFNYSGEMQSWTTKNVHGWPEYQGFECVLLKMTALV